MNGYYKIVIEILKEHGYRYYRNGKGSHEIWGSVQKNVGSHSGSFQTVIPFLP